MTNKSLASRRYVIIGIFMAVGIVYVLRLAYLQIIDDTYKELADRNALRHITQYPSRGLIYDRHGKLLVYNEAVYDLMVIPKQVRLKDTNEFCSLLKISREDFIKKMDKAKKYSYYAPSIFEKQISKEDFAPIQEKIYEYEGFYAQKRTLRYYPDGVASHVLGYIGEVSEGMIEKNPYYKRGDYIGMSGLEKFYEDILRGKKGSKITLVDVHNREKGSFADGKFDTNAISGQNLYSTIDLELQKYAEKIMANKRGCIIAIEPSSGEVLCFVSAPYYDPNLLVGRVRSKNYKMLAEDISKPLFNRVLMAEYPPGSIFKVAQSLIALDMGVITRNTGFVCDKGLVGCHNHPSATCVEDAIKMSCNAYFCYVFRGILENPEYPSVQAAFGKWEKYVKSFGLGVPLGSDIPAETGGNVPSTSYYDKLYGKNRWRATTVISLAIGQGELGCTPLHMANLCATVANRGYYYTPHLIKDSEGYAIEDRYKERHYTLIDTSLFPLVIDGMYQAVNGGKGATAGAAAVEGLDICGKTGTAENPHGKDHSVFVCFAPKDDPKIAVAVYVENGGWGGTWAAPIASLVVEKYLRGEISESRKPLEERIMNGKLIGE